MSSGLAMKMRGAHGGEWKRYPAYKDSGVEWLGAVPEGWEVKRLKNIADINSEVLSEMTCPDFWLQYVDISNVDSRGTILGAQDMRFEDAPSRARRIVRHGDTIISTVRTYLKAIAFIENSPHNLIVSTGFAVLRAHEGINPKYLFVLAMCEPFVETVMANSVGVGYPAISPTVLACLPTWLPPLPEQHAIAAFLDRETAKIDTLVAKKERLVELLEEKRTALISHAVTRGLDPDAPMKDSGIEWLGEVPEGWEIRRNGALFTQRDERGFPDLPLLSVSLHTGTSVREFSSDRIEQMAGDRSTYKRAKKGDIVFNKMRMWQGAVGVAPTDGLVSTDYTVAKPLEGVQPRYFEHLFRTSFYKTETNRYSYGIVPDRNRLYWDRFKQMPSIYPPFNEQLEIVNRLDQLTEQTNRLSGSIREQMDKLKEYRTALISAAVTGKIDVRGEIP